MSPEARRDLLASVAPRVIDPYVPNVPHPPQSVFLWLNCPEAFYGGAAGGGKSDALLMAALQYVDVPGYSALIIRKTWGDLSLPGAVMDRASDWLEDTPARKMSGGRQWIFPSGARLTFGFIQYPRQRQRYRSAEFQFIGFDELTQFDEDTYQFMFSRIRRPAIPCERCTRPTEYVDGGWTHRVGPRCKHCAVRLLEDGSEHVAVKVGQPAGCASPEPIDRHRCQGAQPDRRALEKYPAGAEGLTVFDVPLRMRSASNPGDVGHVWCKRRFVDPETRAPGVVYVPAKLEDNPSLDEEAYVEQMQHMGAIDMARMLHGDWAVNDQGTFRRYWFETIDREQVPRLERIVRYWDMAANDGSGDRTAGALVGLAEGRYYLLDMRCRAVSALENERLVAATALEDGRVTPVRMEQESGSSGVITIDAYRRKILVGFDFDGDRPSGDKAERARPWASAAEAGNFFVVAGEWNRDFLDEVEAFPSKAWHDDQVDAVSGAVKYLTGGRQARLIA